MFYVCVLQQLTLMACCVRVVTLRVGTAPAPTRPYLDKVSFFELVLTLSPPITTKVSYANSLDPDEMPSLTLR